MRYLPMVGLTMLVLALMLVVRPSFANPLQSPDAYITVTGFEDVVADDGVCTLREAITAANTDSALGNMMGECAAGDGADTIILDTGIYTLTREGAKEDNNFSGDLDIAGDVTLVGVGATAINGNRIDRDRVLHIQAGATVFIENLTIQRGRAPHGLRGSYPGGDGQPGEGGGGIYNAGYLTIRNSRITDNQSGQGGNGANGSEFALGGDGGVGGDGGGIYSTGALTVVHTFVVENWTGDGGVGGNEGDQDGLGGPGGDGGNGGGIAGTGFLLLDFSDIALNRTGSGGGGGDSPNYGGEHGGNGGDGGGLFFGGSVTLLNSTVGMNRAGAGGMAGDSADGLGYGGNGGNGGGLYVNRGFLTNTLVIENVAGLSGSGKTQREGRGGNGGGIVAVEELVVGFSALLSNTAGSGNTGLIFGFHEPSPGTAGNGGGIVSNGTLLVRYSTLAYNRGGDGGDCEECYWTLPDAYPSLSAGGAGGGIYATTSFTIVSSTLSHNYGGRGGDATGEVLDDYLGVGGDGGAFFASSGGEIADSTISFNASGLGGTFDTESAPRGEGGGIYGSFTMGNSILAGNVSEVGPDCSGTLVSEGYVLIQDSADCLITGTTTGVLMGTDPLLAALADNGGVTLTHALLSGSPAWDAGSCTPNSTDQRGFPRPIDFPALPNTDNGCDMGAVEQQLVLIYPSRLAVTEGGMSDSYSVTLAYTPTAPVTITLSPDAEVTASSWALVFATDTWSSTQMVMVTAVDDTEVEGEEHGIITHTIVSEDSAYKGVGVAAVDVTIYDNDALPLPTLTPSTTLTPGNTPSPSATATTSATVTASATVIASATPTNTPTISSTALPSTTPTATEVSGEIRWLYLPLVARK